MGPSWGRLGWSWSGLGAVLGSSWGRLGLSSSLAPCWCRVGPWWSRFRGHVSKRPPDLRGLSLLKRAFCIVNYNIFGSSPYACKVCVQMAVDGRTWAADGPKIAPKWRLGAILWRLGAVLGPSWGCLGWSGGRLGAILDGLILLGRLGAVLVLSSSGKRTSNGLETHPG